MPKPALITLIDPASVRRAPNRRGAREIISARSLDGVWSWERGEEAGTPWHIHHVPTGRVFEHAATTFKGARYLTANSSEWLLAEMDRRAAIAVVAA